MLLKSLSFLFVIIVLSSCSSTNVEKKIYTTHLYDFDQEIDTPESVHVVPSMGYVFVSNISGVNDKKDSKGWLSLYNFEGKAIKKKWRVGLHAPKGLTTYEGRLFVTNIDQVHIYNFKAKTLLDVVKVEGAKFLNDIAVKDGVAYVSDTLNSAIYKIEDGKATTWVQGPEFESPNGLLLIGDELVVASWGYTTDWSTKTLGSLYALNLETKERRNITKGPLGNLDGLALKSDGVYLVSDWVGGVIFTVNDQDGEARDILHLDQGTADIAYDAESKLLYVPQMQQNKVSIFKIEEDLEQPKQ